MAEVSAATPAEDNQHQPIDQQPVEAVHENHDNNNNGTDNIHNDKAVTESPAPHEMGIKEYALTRFSTLRPPMHHAPNPFRLLMMLSGKQWLFFLVAFLAWVCGFASYLTLEIHPLVWVLSEYIDIDTCGCAMLTSPRLGTPSTSSQSP